MNGTLQDAHTFLANKFLTLCVKLSIQIFQGFCYTTTPFCLLYVHISFTYMLIHLRGNFMLYIRACLHSFENNFMSHLHWKRNFCTTHSHSWKAISYHMSLLWDAFSCHFQHICTFAKHLATYSTYTCTWWTTFSHYLGTRKTWCSPNQVLALRGNLTNMLSLIMPSCISNNKSLGPLA